MTDDGTGLEAELRSNGVSVESLSTGDPVELSYLTAFPGEQVHHGEMGRALNTFIDLAEDDRWEPVRVEGTALRAADDVLGTWHADPEWFEALLDYRITETEFSTRVLDTLDESGASGGSGSEGSDGRADDAAGRSGGAA
jgi:hypothetical protein